MRATKSSRSILRLAGLASVFVLAVALFLSGATFSSTTAENNVSMAGVSTPSTTSKTIAEWYDIPMGDISSIDTYTYNQSVFGDYSNFYFYSEKNNNSGTRGTDKVEMSNSHTGTMYDEMFAYYKLPDTLAAANAVINVDVTETSSSTGVDSEVNKSVILCSGPSGTYPYDGQSTTFPATVTSSMQYIRVAYGATFENVTMFYTCRITVSNLSFDITINSCNQAPVITAWDGTSSPSEVYGYDINSLTSIYTSNRNIVGGMDYFLTDTTNLDLYYTALDYFDALAYLGTIYTRAEDTNTYSVYSGTINQDTTYYRQSDINEFNDATQCANIYLTSLRTDGNFTKQFSFTLYDYLSGIKSADLSGFDLMTAYKGTSAITDGSSKTYLRADGYSIPRGVYSITVNPFGYKNASTTTGIFRGMQVTVVFNGKDADDVDIQNDTVYVAHLTNYNNTSAKNLVVNIGGLDYTVPDLPDSSNFASEYTLSDDNVPWFDTEDLKYRIVVDEDARNDVIYTYKLYRKATANDDYGTEPYRSGTVEKPNYDNLGDDIVETGLPSGYYRYVLSVSDALGRYYTANPDTAPASFNDHNRTAGNVDFVIDKLTYASDWDGWDKNVVCEDENYEENTWTNKSITVNFNSLPTSIGWVKYYYRYDGETNSANIDWQLITSFDNSFSIGADTDPKYAEGFQRTYYFRALYESGVEFNYSVAVKFDNSNSVQPISTTLLNYPSNAPYTDLLNLTVDVLGKSDSSEPADLSNFMGGSPRTLHYSITRLGSAAREGIADIINGEISLDIFGGENVNSVTPVTVELWFTDEAGNVSSRFTSSVYINTAKIFVAFSLNSINRYYNGDTNVAASLISYQLYSDEACKNAIPSSMLKATFTARYSDANAGENKDVFVSDLALEEPDENSKYAAVYSKYDLKAFSADGKNSMDFVQGVIATQLMIGQHAIQKARLAINQKSAFSYVYNGKNEFDVENCGSDTFNCIDTVIGEGWKDIVWAGKLTFGNKYVSKDGDGNVIAKTAQISEVVLTFASTNTYANNYQLVSASGSTSQKVYCNAYITPKFITMTTNANLSKVYDGTTSVNITTADYSLIGVEAGDLVSLDLTKLNTAKYSSADVGDAYTITVTTELTGYDFRNYLLVDNLTDKNLLTTIDYTGASITAKEVSVSFGTISKIFDNTNKITFVQAYDTPDKNQYQLTGVVECDKTVVSLDINAVYPNVNAGAYTGIPVSVSIKGSNNYKLSANEFMLDANIGQLTVKRITFEGVYVVDSNNNYLYTDTAGAVYQKAEVGYTKYAADATESNVTEEEMLASAGCAKWIASEFVKGGVIIVNEHRIDLGTEVKFALKYEKYDGSVYTLVDFVDTTLPQNKPAVSCSFTFNSNSGNYPVTIGNFGANSNFKLSTNPVRVDSNSDATLVLTILDFDDVKFDGMLYSTGDVAAISGYTTIFDGQVKTVKFTYDTSLGAATGEITYDADAMHVGVYTAKLKFIRNNGLYIAYQTIIINQKATSLELSSYADMNLKYGDEIRNEAEKLSEACINTLSGYEKLGGDGNQIVTSILDNVVYQYSIYEDFSVLLSSAPKLKGAGEYFVRAVYAGNNDFIGSISDVRKINISPVKFVAEDISGSEAQEDGGEPLVDKIEIIDIIDSAFRNNRAVIDCFVVVYLQGVPTIDGSVSPASAYYTAIPTKIGYYNFQIVHKDRIDADGKLITPSRDVNLAKVATGMYYGTLTIGKNSVDAFGTNGIANGNGTLYTTETTPSFPTVSEEQGELRFYAIDQTATNWKGTFNDGLHEHAETLGNYTISTLYNTSLKIAYATGDEDIVTNYNTLKVNLKADAAEGTKLFRFDINADGTYSVTALDYTRNNDGTISFDTDKLGWFAIANEYTPATPKDYPLIIGLTTGGAVVLALAIAIIVVVVKRKRIA